MKSTVYYASEYSSEPNKRAGPNKRAVLNRRAGRNFAQNTKKECSVKTGSFIHNRECVLAGTLKAFRIFFGDDTFKVKTP